MSEKSVDVNKKEVKDNKSSNLILVINSNGVLFFNKMTLKNQQA